jgi:glucose/arabinose dehydrogenase
LARVVARTSAYLCATALFLSAFGAALAQGATLPSGFQDTVVFDELQEPTNFRFASDGRVFVAEKSGRIVVFDDLEDEGAELFADIRKQVYDSGDRGILGMALDPEFTEGRPYVYVLYTYDHILGGEGEDAKVPRWGEPPEYSGDPCPKPGDADVDACPVSGRLVRLTAEGGGNHAVEEGGAPKEEVLIAEDWCQQFSSHSIGDLQFGPEGALYASGGDGASFFNADYGQFGWPEKNQCGDPPGEVGDELTPPTAEGGALRALDLRTPSDPLDPSADPTGLNGSIIRIDPDTGQGLPDNPLFSSSDANERRIVAYGLRNPFRFAIDPVSEELYVDNVGWALYEEMDRFPLVSSQPYNSGWPCWEGPEYAYVGVGLDLCDDLIADEPGASSRPFFYYAHAGGVTPEDPCPTVRGSAITGIAFYEGSAFPAEYEGALFFADAVRGCIYVMFPGEDGRPDPASAVPFMTEAVPYAGADLEVGPDGSLYYVSLAENAIRRITYFSGNQPPVARLSADQESGTVPLHVKFDASKSSDAEGEPLEYEWDTNEDGVYSAAGATVEEEFPDPENRIVAVRVTDDQGAKSTAKLTIYPGDTPPDPRILEPAESLSEPGTADLEWHVGEQIEFEGEATDEEDGPLEPPSLSWSSRVLHCPFGPENCHAHPLQNFPGKAGGTLTAPDHDYPSRIELTLSATDSRGLTVTRTLELEPHPVQLGLQSSPAGIPLTAGLRTETTPYQATVIEGSSVTLSAPATALLGGTTYSWLGWSDDGARVHTITATGPLSFLATYASSGGSGGSGPGGGGSSTGSSATPPPPPAPSPPRTSIRKHPAKRAGGQTAKFAFGANRSGVTFRCKLDVGRYRSCTSPKTYKHVGPGGHVFRVVAIAPDGQVDPTPAVFRWKVL